MPTAFRQLLRKGVDNMALENNFLRLDPYDFEAQRDMELEEQYEKEFFEDLIQKYEKGLKNAQYYKN